MLPRSLSALPTPAGKSVSLQIYHPAEQPSLAETPDKFGLIEGDHATRERLVALVLELRLCDLEALNRDHGVLFKIEPPGDPDPPGIFVLLRGPTDQDCSFSSSRTARHSGKGSWKARHRPNRNH
jgi:hypothetical protein